MLGLYIHVPFCRAKCPYCDFYSLTKADDSLMNRYADRVCKSINEYFSQLRDEKHSVDSIYFGGGTPSLLPTDSMERIMKSISGSAKLCSPQICIEVNPATVSGEMLRFYRSIGINRLSVGMQSAIDGELKALGRLHSESDVEKTVDSARKAGFEDISLDLMLGIPNQTMETLKCSVKKCAELGADHVSMYMLKLEPSTPFGKNPPKNIADEDTLCDMYVLAGELLEKNGFEQYEISNWAKNGKRSRHNMKYWNCDEYLGVGAAAHSFLNGRRFYYERDIESFISDGLPVDDGEGGDFEEYIMLRLRLNDGIIYNEYQARFGAQLDEKYIARAKKLSAEGLAEMREDGFSLTRKGMLVSNSAIGYILTGR